MRRDHRPYWLARWHLDLQRRYADHFIRPQLDELGDGALIIRPWYVRVRGAGIRIGRFAHVVGEHGRLVQISTWNEKGYGGRIEIGDHCLVSPGARISAATRIEIGDASMIAAGAVLSDADWHDLYDRAREVGRTAPITLGRNVWIGEGAMVTKGVTIGDNTIVGAGAIVTSDLPADSIAAGNPARVIRPLDPKVGFVTRASLFPDSAREERDRIAYNMHYALQRNTFASWLRATLFPRSKD